MIGGKLFEKIGFIGLGNMGLPMSKNLLQENFTVYGMDLNKEAELALHHAGGTIGISVEKWLKSVTPSSQAFLPQKLQRRFFWKKGLVHLAEPGVLLIDTSTVAPELNIRIAEEAKSKGIDFLAAPVSGGVIGAVNRTLTFMVGGPKSVLIKRCLFSMHWARIFFM